jgi:hypothetical protein
VRRSIVLALALSALLWTVAAAGPATPESTSPAADAGASQLAGDTHGSGDSNQQWRAQDHTAAAVTESLWKSAPVHAELAGTRSEPAFDGAGAASSPDPPAPAAPPYLRHTPLLI